MGQHWMAQSGNFEQPHTQPEAHDSSGVAVNQPVNGEEFF